jgi:hypothetical protein
MCSLHWLVVCLPLYLHIWLMDVKRLSILIFCDWEAKHVTIGLFEVIDIDIVMAPKL